MIQTENYILKKMNLGYVNKSYMSWFNNSEIINYIGYSVYEVDEIRVLINKFEPDIIQGPISFFDQRNNLPSIALHYKVVF